MNKLIFFIGLPPLATGLRELHLFLQRLMVVPLDASGPAPASTEQRQTQATH